VENKQTRWFFASKTLWINRSSVVCYRGVWNAFPSCITKEIAKLFSTLQDRSEKNNNDNNNNRKKHYFSFHLVSQSGPIALGMESGAIPDDKITASTFKTGYEARKARLNRNSCWMPMQDKNTEYIKINFTSVTNISAIATQGAPNDGCWVTRFSLQWFVNNQLVTDRKVQNIVCQNSCIFSLLVAGDVSRGGTSATQRQKFHTDDVRPVWNLVINADWTTE